MDIREYFQKEQKGFYPIIAKMLTAERRKQLYDAINDWHESELKLLNQSRVSGSYIRIEIVDYFGTKKVIEVKPYFDKQQLTEIEFLNSIRLLEEEKNKVTYAFG